MRGLDAPLGRLRHQGDLNAQIERRGVKRPLFRQPPGHAQPVDAVHPVEALGNGAGLVRLQAADEMPVQRQGAQFVHLCQSLLEIVFTEIRDAGRGGRPYRFGRLGLGNRDQGDGGGIAPGRLGRMTYPGPDVVHVNRQILRTN